MDNSNNEINNARRNFLGTAVTVATGVGLSMLPGQVNSQPAKKRTKNAAVNALGVYNITEFGAVGNGSFLNTSIIQKVIDSCSSNGGGTVFFPPGDFLTGSLVIKNNVNIHLSAGTTIWGSKLK